MSSGHIRTVALGISHSPWLPAQSYTRSELDASRQHFICAEM